MQHPQERGNTTTYNSDFPGATAAKRHPSNTDMSSLQVGLCNQLKTPTSPTNKPKVTLATRSVLSPQISPIPDKRCSNSNAWRHNPTRHRGITCDIVVNHANAALRTALRMDHRKNGTQYGLTRHPRDRTMRRRHASRIA